MVYRVILVSTVIVCSFLFSSSRALAHTPGGNPILDLARCSPRLMVCQQPISTELSDSQPETDNHLCMDAIGVERPCSLEGPFQYLTLPSKFSELEVTQMEPLGFTSCIDGFADQFPCNNVDLLSFLPIAEIGEGNGSDLWGWTDPETGREYALVGRTRGVAFVDITAPSSPVYLGDLPSQDEKWSAWRDLKVYADHAFIVRDGIVDDDEIHGVQIFDLRQLRTVANPPVLFEATAQYTHVDLVHNIAINEETGYAYAVGQRGLGNLCGRGLHMIDISTPAEPTFAGCFGEDGYTHDTQCVIYRGPDFTFQGREICFNANEDTLTIVDVTNKQSPKQLSRVGYPDASETGITTFYLHQGWLSEDQHYFLQNDEFDESYNDNITTRTNIWDVSNLSEPVLVGFHDLGTSSSDHNLYTHGNHVYEANYSTGLRVLKTRELSAATLEEIAYFDTSVDHDDAGFNGGAWSVYPYFESGSVIVSTMTEGLFVLSPQEAPEFTIVPDGNHALVCNATNFSDLIGTTILPPLVDSDARVTISAYHGYIGNVALSAEATAPTGTAILDHNLVAFDEETVSKADAVVQISNDWPTGTHSLTVTGDDGVNNAAATIAIHVSESLAPPVENLAATPVEDAQGRYDLLWSAVAGAELYIMEMATDVAFTNILEISQSTEPGHQTGELLALGQTYYWRVRSINGCGESFSATGQFQTASGVYLPFIP